MSIRELKVTSENHALFDVSEHDCPVNSRCWKEALDVMSDVNNVLVENLEGVLGLGGAYHGWLSSFGIDPETDNGWWSVEAIDPENINAFIRDYQDEDFSERLDGVRVVVRNAKRIGQFTTNIGKVTDLLARLEAP